MAYQPLDGSQYPTYYHHGTAFRHTAPPAGSWPYGSQNVYPQVISQQIPQSSYALQGHPGSSGPSLVNSQQMTTHYQPPPFQPQPPAPPFYGGGNTAPGPYYAVPDRATSQPYAHARYSPQLPPLPQTQSLPPMHSSSLGATPPPPRLQATSQIHIQIPPPPRQQPRISSSTQSPIPQVVIPSPSPSRLATQSMPRPTSEKNKTVMQDSKGSKKLPVDYQVLLLVLANEYLDAAHSKGTMFAASGQDEQLEEYFKLVATALGCLEVVLRMKKSKLQPRTEALVRLRYAKILYEETDNDADAEITLSKGIDLCERNKMLDLKYSMQQLLCRVMFKSNPKAAMKAVDSIINDIGTYRHTRWEYVFRLLRVTLSLASPLHQDPVTALHHLQKLSSTANSNGDIAVSVVSSITEALLHLQHSSSPDSIEHAQRAIGAARTHQLDPNIRDVPQISILIQMVDICCSLLEYDLNQASQKLQAMQTAMDQNIGDPRWRKDGSFSVPITSAATAVESGDVLHSNDGKMMLRLSWLSEHDLFALCYFLSSVTLSAKNSQNGKSEEYLTEGLRMVQSSLRKPEVVSESLMHANSRFQWRQTLYCNMLIQKVFLACSRTDWNLASVTLEELQQAVHDLGEGASQVVKCLVEYLRGIIAQGTGDLKTALAIFRHRIFKLDQSASKVARNDPQRDLSILAGLNVVLILRDPAQQSHDAALKALTDLQPFCKSSPNKYVQAAYSLISATIQTESTLQTKRDLHQALQAAMAISNTQVTCIALTFMSWKYFRGVIGEQSEKSAKAARAMAKKADDKLWTSVTEELLADTLDRQGKSGDGRAARAEADKVLSKLPPALKKTR
ncbi:hypothetical protein VTO42DRAFT_223 [Malbranchea cinnamomea]